jgi:hypothetical protein
VGARSAQRKVVVARPLHTAQPTSAIYCASIYFQAMTMRGEHFSWANVYLLTTRLGRHYAVRDRSISGV